MLGLKFDALHKKCGAWNLKCGVSFFWLSPLTLKVRGWGFRFDASHKKCGVSFFRLSPLTLQVRGCGFRFDVSHKKCGVSFFRFDVSRKKCGVWNLKCGVLHKMCGVSWLRMRPLALQARGCGLKPLALKGSRLRAWV